MRLRYALIIVLLLTLALGVGRLSAGSNLDSPAGPTESAAQMHTLEQIYDRLNDGTATTKMATFTEPSSGPGSTMHTLEEIYDLLGERAPVPKTGQTTYYAAGDDGDLEKGVSWPSPRFADNGDGTVTDSLTGLIWLKNANCGGGKAWASALSWANGLYDGCTSCGTNDDCGLADSSTAGDWRLPNVRELFSLIHHGQTDQAAWLIGRGFSGVQSGYYWSSTTCAGSTGLAWRVNLYGGGVYDGSKTYTRYVWPVRGGQ